MSFEGYYEIICEQGHLSTVDVYDFYDTRNGWVTDPRNACSKCGKPIAFTRLVDLTNGFDENDLSSWSSTQAGFLAGLPHEDIWKEDHYGNKYAVKVLRYRPTQAALDQGEWRKAE